MDNDRANLIENGNQNFNINSNAGVTSPGQTRTDDTDARSDSNVLEPTVYTSQLAAFLVTLNVTVGAGLLAMPFAVQEAGLTTSLMIMVIFVAAIVVTTIICTELTVKTGVESFHKLVRAHCHNYLYQFTQVCILLLVFGTAVAYIVVIGDQTDRVFASLYGHTFCYTWYMNRTFIMSIVTVFVVKPLCCAKTVDFLKYASFAGLVSLAFITYVVISEFIKQGHVAQNINYFPQKWSSLGTILPVFCIAFHCHLSWVPTVATMRKEEKYTSYYTISAAMITAGVIYSIVSIFALLTFGDTIKNDLTQSFTSKTWPVLTTIAIIAFKCVVTLPLAFLPARLSLIDIFSKLSTSFENFKEPTKRISVTIATLNIALLLALYVPDILMAVDILGSLSVMFIFPLPALCYLNLIKENRLMKQDLDGGYEANVPIYSLKDKCKIALSYFFIVFGLVMVVVVLYNSVEKIISENNSKPICYKNVTIVSDTIGNGKEIYTF